MAVGIPVVGRLFSQVERSGTSGPSDIVDFSAREDLIGITLMSDIEKDIVRAIVEMTKQCNRQFDDTEVAGKMSAVIETRRKDVRADIAR